MTAPQTTQLPTPPTLTDDERQFLHYNPNTSDIEQWVYGYAEAYARSTLDAHVERLQAGQGQVAAYLWEHVKADGGVVARGLAFNKVEPTDNANWRPDGDPDRVGTRVTALTYTSPPTVAQVGVADARRLLIDAGRVIAWQRFGECRAYDHFGDAGPLRAPDVVDAEIRAALAAQPQRVALSPQQITCALIKADVAPSDDYESVFEEGVKAAERLHGITPGDGSAK